MLSLGHCDIILLLVLVLEYMFEVIAPKSGMIPLISLRVPASIVVEKLRTSFFVWIMSTQATYDFIIIGGKHTEYTISR